MARTEEPSLVVLSGIRWGFLWQRHQALASELARRGHRTVFVETTGLSNPKPRAATARRMAERLLRPGSRSPGSAGHHPNLTVYAPLVAPPTSRTFRRLNRALFVPRVVRDLRRLAGPRPAVIAYPPTETTLEVLRQLEPRSTLYDCADDYEQFPGAPADIAQTERELLRSVDRVSCTSTPLLEKVRPVRPDAYLSGPGVDFELFREVGGSGGGAVRTVCFFGHIGERVDAAALRAVAGAGYGVRLVGELDSGMRWLLGVPGVDYRGAVPHAELPEALRGVDALLIPYRMDGLTRAISPAKTLECLATGLPVVAAPLPALLELGEHVYFARSPGEFVEALERLPLRETEERVRARVGAARRNGWEVRAEEAERALGLSGAAAVGR